MKMFTYLSTFISGFSEIIDQIMRREIKDIEIIELSDGAILYRTKIPRAKILKIDFLNNTFIVLKFFSLSKKTSFEKIIKKIIHSPELKNMPLPLLQKEFKVFFSRENAFVKIEVTERKRLTDFLTGCFHLVNKPSSQRFNEFWLAERTGNFFALMLRVSNVKMRAKKGELRSELASFLVYLSDPTPQDRMWDPFAGSGSIPFKRMKFPYEKIIISDNDQKNINHIKKGAGNFLCPNKGALSIFKYDFIKGEPLHEQVTKIITDPPWGIHQEMNDKDAFYFELIQKAHFSLAPGGLMVFLVSRQIDLKKILLCFNHSLSLLKSIEILVSGKKATVYKIIKK